MQKLEPLDYSKEYRIIKETDFVHIYHRNKGITSCRVFDDIAFYPTGVLITKGIGINEKLDKEMYSYTFFNKKNKAIFGVKDYLTNCGGCAHTVTVCDEGLFVQNETVALTGEEKTPSKLLDLYTGYNYEGKEIFNLTSETGITPEMVGDCGSCTDGITEDETPNQ